MVMLMNNENYKRLKRSTDEELYINFISFSDINFEDDTKHNKYKICDDKECSLTEISPRKIRENTRKRTRSGGNPNGSIEICRMGKFPEIKNDLYNWTQDVSKTRIERAGVIVYTYIDGELLFGLGVDSKHKEITDFGGGVGKKDMTVKNGLLREMEEEMLGVCGAIKSNELDQFICIYTNLILITFIKLDVCILDQHKLFMNRLNEVKNPEVNEIVWYTKNNFINLIMGNMVKPEQLYDDHKLNKMKMFDRIRPMLREAYIKRDFMKYL